MYRFLIYFIVFIFSCVAQNVYAASHQNDMATFEQIFNEWTTSFNNKNAEKTCSVFSKSVVGDYQGAPQKNYAALCDGFKKLFQKPNYRYHYRYKLHDVHRSGDLAIARITWYLDVYENGQKTSATQDEGMDVLEKNASDNWQIIRYLSYMSPVQACQWLNCY